MFSLLASRFICRLPSKVLSQKLANTSLLSGLSVPLLLSQTRRTFISTPGVHHPIKPSASETTSKANSKNGVTKATRKKTASTKKNTRNTNVKPAAKKRVTNGPITRKRSSLKKKTAKTKAKPVKPKKLIITQDMKPPRQPPGAYLSFFEKYRAGIPKVNSLEEMRAVSKATGEAWRALSDAEKKPFFDESAEQYKEYYAKRDAYWKNISSSTVRAINKVQTAKGKHKIRNHRLPEDRRPLNAYLRFVADFRKSEAAQLLENVPANERMVIVVKAAAEAWRNASTADKEAYHNAAKAELALWQSQRLSSASTVP